MALFGDVAAVHPYADLSQQIAAVAPHLCRCWWASPISLHLDNLHALSFAHGALVRFNVFLSHSERLLERGKTATAFYP